MYTIYVYQRYIYMTDRFAIFQSYTLEQKKDHLTDFYQKMIKKTNNSVYIHEFESKLKKINACRLENEEYLEKVYTHILRAKESKKDKEIKSYEMHRGNIITEEDEEDPDEFLMRELCLHF